MKRLLCTVLSFLLLTTVLLSCSEASDDANETKENLSEVPDSETADPMADNLPDIEFDGADYNILAACEQWANDYYIEALTGDIVNDAVYERNRIIEDRFNVKLNYIIKNGYFAGKADISTALQGSVMGGSGDYDLSIISSGYVSDRIVEGIFTDLNQLDYLDFSRDWWIHNVNSQLTINNKLYVAAGKYALCSISDSWAIFFNKKLITDNGLEMPYALVDNGGWTYDKMLEYSERISSDLDGNGRYDKNDRYVLIGTSTEPFYAFPVSLGHNVTLVDNNGLPTLTGASEQTVNTYTRLLELYKNKSLYYGTESANPSEGLLQMFASGQGLFMVYPIKVTARAEMREMEHYGIVPMPKYDEAQKEYKSLCFTDTYAIPKVVGIGLDNSALILEALNAENYRSVIPQYYNIALTRKYTRDDDSEKMLDIISNGATLDFGIIFASQLDSRMYWFSLLFNENVTSYATWWASNEKSLTIKLNDIIETITSMG